MMSIDVGDANSFQCLPAIVVVSSRHKKEQQEVGFSHPAVVISVISKVFTSFRGHKKAQIPVLPDATGGACMEQIDNFTLSFTFLGSYSLGVSIHGDSA